MKRIYRHNNNLKKIIGMISIIIGIIILINFIPLRFMVFVLGVSLLLIGVLVLKAK